MAKVELPVDEFKDEILHCVQHQRVTIIQGDTGCGKSSRIPIMLLEAPPPNPNMTKSKMFISVPRRIAAKALVERLRAVEPEFRDEIALRMGHGVKEYESSTTRAWFVTTGYLVRLLANHPEHFNGMSHLVIDEIHERSVETDILCLLCRRLLETNPHIRLVLMSATLAASLYQDYFGEFEPPIKVGAKRFPVEAVYLGELSRQFRFPTHLTKNLKSLEEDCGKLRCKVTPSASYMEKLYSVVAHLATVVGKPGSSVLIFVPGMNDIISLTEIVEEVQVKGVVFQCIPIHSDIPFEDQMHVFDEAAENEVRIIIATNAAESSLTLPDVDHVICLGLCKQIIYNKASHRQLLTQAWISRASATQRAGRTGRLRPGTVYRMYTRENYNNEMQEFEEGEILRTPLDSVILMLKEMLGSESSTDVLSNCIEPPDISAIQAAYRSLHQLHFLSSPDDVGYITELGLFSCSLGVDLALCALIGLAIQFGVGAEAIQMAAILSFPKSPWIMSNPLIHKAESFNETMSTTFASKCYFDAHLFSDPFGQMNLLHDFGKTNIPSRHRWCKQNGVFLPRMKRLQSTYENLRRRVASYLRIDDDKLAVKTSLQQLPEGKLTVLRIVQVWAFHESLIQFDGSSCRRCKIGGKIVFNLDKQSSRIEKAHFKGILRDEEHYQIAGYNEVKQVGYFLPAKSLSAADFIRSFEPRCLSYCSEKLLSISCVSVPGQTILYISQELYDSPEFEGVVANFAGEKLNLLESTQDPTKKRRGLAERSSGLWDTRKLASISSKDGGVVWYRLEKAFSKPKQQKNFLVLVQNEFKSSCGASETASVVFSFRWEKNKKGNRKIDFTAISGYDENGISGLDLRDLCGNPIVESSLNRYQDDQKVIFDIVDQSVKGGGDREPLIECIPEGARLLSILASSRRREHCILLPVLKNSDALDTDKEAIKLPEARDEEKTTLVKLPHHTMISKRWKRFNTDKVVYVDENSVVSSAVPINTSEMLYCCAANTLEVRGGGIRAEGLTMLPPGRLFLLLCRISLGLFNQDHIDDGSIYEKSAAWADPSATKKQKAEIVARVKQAVQLHLSSLSMQEKLQCFPDKTRELLGVFDGVNGRTLMEWKDLQDDPFLKSSIDNKSRQQIRPKECMDKKSGNGDRRVFAKPDAVSKVTNEPKPKKTKAKNPKKKKKSNGKVATQEGA